MASSFKDHEFSEAEKLWLQEAYSVCDLDIKTAKVKLRDKLPRGFDPKQIDNRFLRGGKRLTLLGVWHVDKNSKILQHVDSVVRGVRELILNNPGIEVVSAKQLSKVTDLEESCVATALWYLATVGNFWSAASGDSGTWGYLRIELSNDEAYDAYLDYENLTDLMEAYYASRGDSGQRIHYPEDVASYIVGSSSLGSFVHSSTGKGTEATKRNTAFVLMAMNRDNPELEDVYHALKETCRRFDLDAYRADEIEHQECITDRILSEISTCEFLIADVTHERPNVYYEIGYAHAIGKRPILYRKKGTRLEWHFPMR